MSEKARDRLACPRINTVLRPGILNRLTDL